jgi:hypothetical protein
MRTFYSDTLKRISSIEEEINQLKAEARLWKLTEPLKYNSNLLIDGDNVTPRTVQKFALLGQIAQFLTKNAYNRQNGATASQIYGQLSVHFPAMSQSTFRSQLSRFKSEGRLTYDELSGQWQLAARKE